MLLWTLIAHSNYVSKYITILTLFSPRYYPLTPFIPVQPSLPSKVGTYADNYRCVANYWIAHSTTPTSTKFTWKVTKLDYLVYYCKLL